MKLKRILSVLTAAGICLACVPLMPVTMPAAVLTASAAAASGACGDHVRYELKDDVLTISGTGPMWDYDRDHIADWRKSDELSFSKAVISDGVTHIGGFAFYGCKKLTDITIPDGVTSIGDSAFEGCCGLRSISIPDSVTSICDHADAELVQSFLLGKYIRSANMPRADINRDGILNAVDLSLLRQALLKKSGKPA